MLRKDLPIRNDLMDGIGIAGISTITVYANPIISPVRNDLGGDPGGTLQDFNDGYPLSQTSRYVPSSVSVPTSTWVDVIRGLNCTLNNSSYLDNAVNFNGVSTWGQFPSAMLPSTSDFSLSIYVSPTNYSATRAIFSQVGTTTAGSLGRALMYSGSPSNFVADIYEATGAGGSTVSVGSTGYTANWHLMTFTRNGNLFRLYINGVLVASQTLTGVVLANRTSRLGRYSDAAPVFFLGKIRYIGICNTALTLAEIQDEYTKILTL